jgi:aryl-phospho-beta-D-glucosidase BglC (GH1 family)
MGRLGQNPSSRGYATPTYATTPLTARETFGGTSKAGLGRHIGMGPFTYGAIVNGSSGHQASFLAGNSFPAAFRAGQLLDMKYPISDTNQLARVGTGTTGGMTRTPADGVNLKQREEMQTRVDKWNKVWPSMPQRDTPNDCCKSIPYLNQDDDHTNLTANETLYGNSGSFGDMLITPPKNPIGALSHAAASQVKFTYMPTNGLQGVSFFNLLYGQCAPTKDQFTQWGTSYIKNQAIYEFVKEQGFNCIRFPLTVWPGTDFGGGPCDNAFIHTYFDTDGKVTEEGKTLTEDIVTGITMAADNGLYSIIDWHTYGISTNGAYDIDGAFDPNRTAGLGWDYFFYNLIKQIASNPNFDKINNYLIWEVFNEPAAQWVNWTTSPEVDENYAWRQINVIREYEQSYFPTKTEHLIIIGTSFHSKLLAWQEPPYSGPVDLDSLPQVPNYATNICFAMHFYTGGADGHDAEMIKTRWGFQSQKDTQNESGVGVVLHEQIGKYYPVFISECGPQGANGALEAVEGGTTYTPLPEEAWTKWNSVLSDLGVQVNGSESGQLVQSGQPIVVWSLTGWDNGTPEPKAPGFVLINEPATENNFTPTKDMDYLRKSFFG